MTADILAALVPEPVTDAVLGWVGLALFVVMVGTGVPFVGYLCFAAGRWLLRRLLPGGAYGVGRSTARALRRLVSLWMLGAVALAAPVGAQEPGEPAVRPILERIRAADVDVTEDSAPDRRLCLNVGTYVMFGERADEELSTVAGMVLFPEDDEEERWVLAGLVVDSRSRRWGWKSFVVDEPACYNLRVVGHTGGRVRLYELILGWTPSDDTSSEAFERLGGPSVG